MLPSLAALMKIEKKNSIQREGNEKEAKEEMISVWNNPNTETRVQKYYKVLFIVYKYLLKVSSFHFNDFFNFFFYQDHYA